MIQVSQHNRYAEVKEDISKLIVNSRNSNIFLLYYYYFFYIFIFLRVVLAGWQGTYSSILLFVR